MTIKHIYGNEKESSLNRYADHEREKLVPAVGDEGGFISHEKVKSIIFESNLKNMKRFVVEKTSKKST